MADLTMEQIEAQLAALRPLDLAAVFADKARRRLRWLWVLAVSSLLMAAAASGLMVSQVRTHQRLATVEQQMAAEIAQNRAMLRAIAAEVGLEIVEDGANPDG